MLLLLLACSSPPPPAAPAVAPDPAPPNAGPIDSAWVDERVADAEARLQASEGGQLLARSIEAHGGLTAWYRAGTLRFDFDYAPVDAPNKRRYTRNHVDLWRARVAQVELGEGADATLGWDGSRAWVHPTPDAFPADARFWALTPYYFVGVPWVLADPGGRWEDLGEVTVGGQTSRAVKASFGEGIGDAPDDYYILHLNPETWMVTAVRYIVSYPAFFPDGGHSPEKLMAYTDYAEVDGLRVVSETQTHGWSAETLELGEVHTRTHVSEVGFGGEIPAERFAGPPDARVIEAP